MRVAAILVVLTVLGACTAPASGPAGQPSASDVNPISGNRGGSGAR